MKKFIEGVWSFLVLAFWVVIGLLGTVLGIVTWPMMVTEYAAVGIALRPDEILGMGVVLVGIWPLAGATGVWLHCQRRTWPRPRGL